MASWAVVPPRVVLQMAWRQLNSGLGQTVSKGRSVTKAKKQIPTWKVRNRRADYEWEEAIVAYWEVSHDPISDDYTPQEIDARELFRKWVKQVRGKYPNELVPIFWFVQCEEHGMFEGMPFQFKHFPDMLDEDFLTFFAWPINSVTGERLNWLTLPVADKLWNSKCANKGEFIQEATQWKPAILQPYVYLPALTSALREY